MPASTSRPSDPGGRAVLLVEDEPSIAVTLTDDLVDHGYAVEHLADGALAIARLEARRFDAVISDLRLPGRDGLQVLRRARALGQDVRLLLITALAAAVEPGALRDAGCALLTKPFANDAVLTWLGRPSRREPPRERD